MRNAVLVIDGTDGTGRHVVEPVERRYPARMLARRDPVRAKAFVGSNAEVLDVADGASPLSEGG